MTIYRHSPSGLARNTRYRVDTASGSVSAATIQSPNTDTTISGSIVGSDLLGRLVFEGTAATLYLKELGYQDVATGTVVTSTGAVSDDVALPSASGGGGGGGGASAAGLPANYVARTTAYTALAGDAVEADVTSGGFAITLPLNPAVGALVSARKIDASGNTLTIVPSGGGTIDGDANATTTTRWAGAVFEHKGSNVWRVIASMTTTGPQGPTGAVPNLTSGTISTLAAGASATATITGTNPDYVLNLGLPTGAQGIQGGAGSANFLFLGDGTDGAGTVTGGTTTLTRDMHYTTLTVSGTGILIPGGWRIFCRGAVTVASGGAIHMDGGSGTAGAGGLRPGSNQAALCQGSAGVNASQTGAGNAASAVVGGANSLGGTGGAGGASGANAGGTTVALGGTFAAVPYLNAWRNHATLALGHPVWTQTNNVASSVPIAGGGGGGGGANDGTGATGAGGSGAGGGVMILNALTVTNSGRISANGGAGGNGSSRNGGGGGGGGGGVVFVNTATFTGTQPTATGGAGGTPFGTGSAGVAGNDGTVHVGLV